MNKKDITDLSTDGNPGTANAFAYGGFWCGMLTLCGDLLKGMLPVHLYLGRHNPDAGGIGLIFVLAAPVAGHIFPVFHGFRGGKGIAVTFGVLSGLMPDMRPALILAAVFLIFSFVIRITPDYNRTLWAYRCAAVCMFLPGGNIKVAAAEALKEEMEFRGHHTVILNPYTLHSNRLADRINNIYLFLAAQVPWFFGMIYKAGALYRKLPVHSPVYSVNRRMIPVMEKYLMEHPADMIIMTHIFPGEIITGMKNQGLDVPGTILVSTDYTCIPFSEEVKCDAYVIPSEQLTGHFTAYGIPEDRIYPLGIPVNSSFRDGESREEARRRLGLDGQKKYILVCAGSMGCRKIKKVIRKLTACIAGREGIGLIAICGNNQKLYRQLKASETAITVVGYTNDMAEYMKAADIFVTKPGGLSSTEAAVCNIPILHTAAIPGCETCNARYFKEYGMSVSCKSRRSGAAALELLYDQNTCAEMTGRQRVRIHSDAASAICNLAEDLYAEGKNYAQNYK